MTTLLGLRTVIYPAADLAASKVWFTKATGVEPYFDEPFYVGFNIGGYELGLDPHATRTVTYWGVNDIEEAVNQWCMEGAIVVEPINEVGDGIKVAILQNPLGNEIGLIENPHFQV